MVTEQRGTAGTVVGLVGLRLSQEAEAYAASRQISRETLVRFGVGSGTAFFPRRLQRRSEALYFPYHLGGSRVNWKAAAFPDKDFISEPGGKLCFFNLDTVLAAAPDVVYITEGEWDALALVEAGIPQSQVMSVPNGARETSDDAGPPKGYGYVTDALAMGLGRVKRFVWCGDNDSAGFVLRADMVRILGPAKFWYVEWPLGAKDANDFLITDGPAAVNDLVLNGQLPWPVDGLFPMDRIPVPPVMTTWRCGFPEWEDKVLLAPGTLSVVTGHPGHGKTQLWAQVWGQICLGYDVVACMASFETKVKPHHQRILRSLHSGKAVRDMDYGEIKRADDWINEHYLWAIHPQRQPTLDWLLDMAEVAVVRHGAKVFQIDPWNRVEGTRPQGESETDYIGRCLTALYQFAEDFNVHMQVLAHPAKMDQRRKDEPPLLEDIAGSKHWDNRVDQGFVVHRPTLVRDDGGRATEAILFHRKARFDELGYPCKLSMNFDLARYRYVSTDYAGVV